MEPASPTHDTTPGTKRCPKLILEGTRMTHKTDLAFALEEHPRITGPRRYRYHSPLILLCIRREDHVRDRPRGAPAGLGQPVPGRRPGAVPARADDRPRAGGRLRAARPGARPDRRRPRGRLRAGGGLARGDRRHVVPRRMPSRPGTLPRGAWRPLAPAQPAAPAAPVVPAAPAAPVAPGVARAT